MYILRASQQEDQDEYQQQRLLDQQISSNIKKAWLPFCYLNQASKTFDQEISDADLFTNTSTRKENKSEMLK